MDSFSSSSYLLGHLPDYTNLWARPPPPQLTRPASPPRRNAVSMNDARTQNYMADLQHNATLRAAYHHSIGGYLPSRAGPSSAMYAYGMDETSSLASTSGSSSASRLKPQPRRAYPGAYAAGSHAPPWRGDWKEEVKLREAIESGSVWSGSGVTDEEERALAHEETLDLDMRAALLSYGRSTLTILGRGRTMQEEQAELEDREAYASNFPGAAAAGMAGGVAPFPGAGAPGVGPTVGRGGAAAYDPRAGAESRASANTRAGGGGGRTDGAARAASGGARADQGEGTNATMDEDEGNVNPHAGQDPRGRGPNDNSMDEEDAVFEGEYTLDDGRGDDIVDAYADGGGGGGGDGEGDLDLDAGIQSMD